jgi:hypothetical protein
VAIRLDQRSLEKLLNDQPEIFNSRERRKIKRRRRKKPEKQPSMKGLKIGRNSIVKNGEIVQLSGSTIKKR